MDSVDVLLRVAGGTLLATLALFVVSDRPRDRASWLFALFAWACAASWLATRPKSGFCRPAPPLRSPIS